MVDAEGSSADAMRSRRRRAASLFEAGGSQAEVARRVGVSRVTAMRWHRIWLAGGRDALTREGRPGRPPRLDREQLDRVDAALRERRPPSGRDRWTLTSIARLIRELTGVDYHPGHVWRLVRAMGWPLPRRTPSGEVEFLFLLDPEGNRLCLYEVR